MDLLESRTLLAAQISGATWSDANGDGVRDAGEPGLADWSIYLDLNDNGEHDVTEPLQVTDANGDYSFTGLAAGTYKVGELQQTGWLQTSPGVPSGPNVELFSHVSLGSIPGGNSSANDIWGYVSPSGREYAIIGLQRGTGYIEVTDPSNPVVVAFIPGPDELAGLSSGHHGSSGHDESLCHDDCGSASAWRDMKVYDHYAYITNEAGGGLQIVNLEQIDLGTVTVVGTLTANGLKTAHNISINPVSGYAYLTGANIANGGLVAIDVGTDPENPTITGTWSVRYLHDAELYSYTSGPMAGREIAYGFGAGGGVYVIDVSDKSSMFTVANRTYPNMTYTHYGALSADQKYLFVNDELDELQNANVTTTTTYVFDVQDPGNPNYLTSFTNGLPSIDHNLRVRDNFLFEANYTSGLRVYNVSDVMNVVETGYYDTYPAGNGPSFHGAWGVFTDLPSESILVSDIHGGLFVLDATVATTPRGFHPVRLEDGDVQTGIDFGNQPALTVSILSDSISENGGTTTGTVTRSGNTTNALTVNLSSSDIGEATVPATVTIAAGQTTSPAFSITGVDDSIIDGTQTVTIVASVSAGGFSNGSDTLQVTDDEPFEAHIDFGTSTSPLAIGYTRVTISDWTNLTGGGDRDRATGSDLERDFVFMKDGTYTLGGVPAGTYDVTLYIGDLDPTKPVRDDNDIYLQGILVENDLDTPPATMLTRTYTGIVVDGSGNLILRAIGLGGSDKNVFLAGMEVVPAGPPLETLTVSILSDSISENGGTTTGTVTRSGDTTNALTVNLSSDDIGEATVPATVTIAAGQTTSPLFSITGVDDSIIDGTQTVTIVASVSAGGFSNGSDTLQVTDDEPFEAHIDFGTSTSPLAIGYTRVTISDWTNLTGGGNQDRATGSDLERDLVYMKDGTYTLGGVPAGTYDVTLYIGDLDPTKPVRDANDIYLQGILVENDLDTPTATMLTRTYTGIVVGGSGNLILRAIGLGGSDNNVFMAGMEVVPAGPPLETLTVSILSDSISENGGTTTGTVTRSGNTTNALTVNLSSSDIGEATVPATVTIAAGQTTSPAFSITGVDDSIIDGTQTVTIVASVSAGGFSNGSDTLQVTDDDQSQYQIDVIFIDNSLTASQKAIFTAAANRWAEIIIGDVPDVFAPGTFFTDGIGRNVDDLVIEASAPVIDGVGGILGQAGPIGIRSGSSLPAVGIMQFDKADVASLEASGQLIDVILHEMGHVIGIGTIWDDLSLLTGAGGSNPRFTGAGAVAEYNSIFGTSATSVPVANTGGSGTRDSHWRESVFANELMTGYLNGGVPNPISRVTVASLGDLGYVVNLGAADFYNPPSGFQAASSSANPGKNDSSFPPPEWSFLVGPHRRSVPVVPTGMDFGGVSFLNVAPRAVGIRRGNLRTIGWSATFSDVLANNSINEKPGIDRSINEVSGDSESTGWRNRLLLRKNRNSSLLEFGSMQAPDHGKDLGTIAGADLIDRMFENFFDWIDTALC